VAVAEEQAVPVIVGVTVLTPLALPTVLPLPLPLGLPEALGEAEVLPAPTQTPSPVLLLKLALRVALTVLLPKLVTELTTLTVRVRVGVLQALVLLLGLEEPTTLATPEEGEAVWLEKTEALPALPPVLTETEGEMERPVLPLPERDGLPVKETLWQELDVRLLELQPLLLPSSLALESREVVLLLLLTGLLEAPLLNVEEAVPLKVAPLLALAEPLTDAVELSAVRELCVCVPVAGALGMKNERVELTEPVSVPVLLLEALPELVPPPPGATKVGAGEGDTWLGKAVRVAAPGAVTLPEPSAREALALPLLLLHKVLEMDEVVVTQIDAEARALVRRMLLRLGLPVEEPLTVWLPVAVPALPLALALPLTAEPLVERLIVPLDVPDLQPEALPHWLLVELMEPATEPDKLEVIVPDLVAQEHLVALPLMLPLRLPATEAEELALPLLHAEALPD